MKSIQRVFIKIRDRNPLWSDLICFAETVKGRSFTRPTITRHFKNLVNKDDYYSKDKNTILRQFHALSLSEKTLEHSDFKA